MWARLKQAWVHLCSLNILETGPKWKLPSLKVGKVKLPSLKLHLSYAERCVLLKVVPTPDWSEIENITSLVYRLFKIREDLTVYER